MKLNWNELSAISQVVGTFAIVLTLLFLSLQTRQQTQAIVANTRQGALEVEIDLIMQMQRDPELWHADYPKVAGYSDELAKKIMINNLAMFRSRENLWLQYTDGALDADIWNSYRDVLVGNLRDLELVRANWEFLSPSLNAEFVADIDGRVQDAAARIE